MEKESMVLLLFNSNIKLGIFGISGITRRDILNLFDKFTTSYWNISLNKKKAGTFSTIITKALQYP